MKFIKEKPSRDDIELLVKNNSIAAACWATYKLGHMTYEEMLIMMVVAISSQNDSYSTMISRHFETCPNPPILYNV